MITDSVKSVAARVLGELGLSGHQLPMNPDAVDAFQSHKPKAKGKNKYDELQGNAAKHFRRMMVGIGKDGKQTLRVPNSMTVVVGNSPIAMSYLMRRKMAPDRISTLKKAMRARRKAIAQAGDSFMLPNIPGVS